MLREISWHKATKSNNYHICSSRVNVADVWRERACILSVEVSQRFHLPSNNELREVSKAHSSEEVSIMETERRGEQSISLSMSRIAEKTNICRNQSGKRWSDLARRKGKNAWTQVV